MQIICLTYATLHWHFVREELIAFKNKQTKLLCNTQQLLAYHIKYASYFFILVVDALYYQIKQKYGMINLQKSSRINSLADLIVLTYERNIFDSYHIIKIHKTQDFAAI